MVANRSVQRSSDDRAGLVAQGSGQCSCARRSSRSRRAFSLVELAMVLLIIGIIAAIAMPRLATGQSRYLVDSAARRIAADLDRARTQAVASSSARTVSFDVAASTYTIAGLASMDRRSASTVVSINQEPYKARIVQVNFNGSSALTWDGFGTASASGSIVVGVGPDQCLISVDKGTSVITIQSASATAATVTPPTNGTGGAPDDGGSTGPIGGLVQTLLPGLMRPFNLGGGVP